MRSGRTMKRRKTIKRRLERVIPGIGRKLIRTGARSASEHKARIALFDRLLEAGQLDVIGMLLRKEIAWPELRQAQRKKRLQSDTLAADVALVRRLWDEDEKAKGALSLTVKRMGRTASSRERYS